MKLDILTDSDPRVRLVAEPVVMPGRALDHPFSNPRNVTALIRDMEETLAYAGGIGLAAPQVGVSLRVILVCLRGDPEGLMRAFMDPRIIALDGESICNEGCLSLPGASGQVRRAETVTIEYATFSGPGTRRYTARGLEAACIQHEIDHLDGILFTDKLIGGAR